MLDGDAWRGRLAEGFGIGLGGGVGVGAGDGVDEEADDDDAAACSFARRFRRIYCAEAG